MRSEVELWVGAGLHGSRGRACPPNRVSSLEPEEALPGPRSGEAAEPLAVGRAAQNRDWKVLEINGQLEELGRRPWVSPQGAPILKEEGETQALDFFSLGGRKMHKL